MTLTEYKDIATLISVIIGACSLLAAAITMTITVKTNRAKFWLELRSAFAKHDDVHKKLRNGGIWAMNKGPNNTDEYFLIEAYMGLFEHCEIMLSQNLIDEKTFHEIYYYRVLNLLNNNWVRVVKLQKNAAGWERFLALVIRMEKVEKEKLAFRSKGSAA